jgi:hypothetical protein
MTNQSAQAVEPGSTRDVEKIMISETQLMKALIQHLPEECAYRFKDVCRALGFVVSQEQDALPRSGEQ